MPQPQPLGGHVNDGVNFDIIPSKLPMIDSISNLTWVVNKSRKQPLWIGDSLVCIYNNIGSKTNSRVDHSRQEDLGMGEGISLIIDKVLRLVVDPTSQAWVFFTIRSKLPHH
ncbi:hypothetical protein VNO77_33778 [Canavalia gladiata]|uniref:Uncharacterized protein n=1 Tax=Canavalia gladiata TaxID=3824 RepID=A0AAN9KEF8_CANGL